jgi:hypothetical protein
MKRPFLIGFNPGGLNHVQQGGDVIVIIHHIPTAVGNSKDNHCNDNSQTEANQNHGNDR